MHDGVDIPPASELDCIALQFEYSLVVPALYIGRFGYGVQRSYYYYVHQRDIVSEAARPVVFIGQDWIRIRIFRSVFLEFVPKLEDVGVGVRLDASRNAVLCVLGWYFRFYTGWKILIIFARV